MTLCDRKIKYKNQLKKKNEQLKTPKYLVRPAY